MTKKKRELIEILLDNITPDDWPEGLPFAAQDKSKEIYFYPDKPNVTNRSWVNQYEFINTDEPLFADSLCKHWNKTIVHRDEFMKRWNERIQSATNTTTPPEPQNKRTEETKPIQQEAKATDTQVGGNHYTKLAIQPMRYSMENGLDALQHTVIKYVTRFRDKNGIEDLEKAKHCIDMLIEYEHNKE